jgi:hypothetical protein
MQKNITTQRVFLLEPPKYQPVGILTARRDALMWAKEKDFVKKPAEAV